MFEAYIDATMVTPRYGCILNGTNSFIDQLSHAIAD